MTIIIIIILITYNLLYTNIIIKNIPITPNIEIEHHDFNIEPTQKLYIPNIAQILNIINTYYRNKITTENLLYTKSATYNKKYSDASLKQFNEEMTKIGKLSGIYYKTYRIIKTKTVDRDSNNNNDPKWDNFINR